MDSKEFGDRRCVSGVDLVDGISTSRRGVSMEVGRGRKKREKERERERAGRGTRLRMKWVPVIGDERTTIVRTEKTLWTVRASEGPRWGR